MVAKDLIREVIIDNRKFVNNKVVIDRNFHFMNNACYVLIGVRRAGKSYLLYQQIQKLLREGHSWDEIVYINFEDERLLEMQTDDLNKILGVHQIISDKQPILFLDEIQNIAGWDKFARRLSEGKYIVFITGSNAKMLSQDVATTLGGKFIIKNIFPYSFTEFLSANQVKITENSFYSTSERSIIQKYMSEYFYEGGFPESLNYEDKQDYLQSVYQKIYIGDIATRNKVDNIFGLRLMFKKLAENVMHPISYTRLTNIVKSLSIVNNCYIENLKRVVNLEYDNLLNLQTTPEITNNLNELPVLIIMKDNVIIKEISGIATKEMIKSTFASLLTGVNK